MVDSSMVESTAPEVASGLPCVTGVAAVRRAPVRILAYCGVRAMVEGEELEENGGCLIVKTGAFRWMTVVAQWSLLARGRVSPETGF